MIAAAAVQYGTTDQIVSILTLAGVVLILLVLLFWRWGPR